jgi:F0F1-type ATP synthase membrane subunit c/vacuolar-type H+-ATPase subunit K
MRRIGVIAAAAVLTIFGVAAVVQGLDGRSTVRSALQQEEVVGQPYMTPAGIAAKAKDAGLRDVTLPDCSVAGKPVDDGASARCFAEYMRIDALVAANGSTYAQLPRFATDDGKGTNNAAKARKDADGQPVTNPARSVWVTQTALSTALNTSYMAEQISLFGIAVGAAFLLVGLAFGAVALGGVKLPARAPSGARRRQAEKAPQMA